MELGRAFAWSWALVFGLWLGVEASAAPTGNAPETGARAPLAEWQANACLVFFGDSITDFGWYLPYVQLGLACRMPKLGLRVVNAGVGGDTVGRAMYRLDFDALRFKPQRVCVLMGCNSLPRSSYATQEDTAQKQAAIEGAEAEMRKCLAAIRASGAEPVLFSLTAYDSYNTTSSTNYRYLNEIGFKELNERYQALAAATQVPYVDLWSGMTAIMQQSPEHEFCGKDRLHPSRTGHLIVALEMLQAFGAFDHPASVTVQGEAVQTENATVEDLKRGEGTVSFRYTPLALPFPSDASYAELAACSALPDAANREIIRIVGLPPGEYALQADGTTIAKRTAMQLADGVNVAALETPNQLQARKLLPLMAEFHAGTVPLRKIAACKMIARQEGADLSDTPAVDQTLDAWLEKCRQPPGQNYQGRKQAVEIYRQNRDRQAELEKRLDDLRARMYALATPQAFELTVKRIGDAPAVFYVDPQGDDGNPGTRERPLATFEAARDAARKAPAGTIRRIVALPGDYYLPRTLGLDARDNGLIVEGEDRQKTTLYGGPRIAEWQRDGDHLWYAELPGVKEGKWDFRALVVDGRLADRACLPATGAFQNTGTWNQKMLPALMGFWERKPTHEELVTMPYDPKDIPATLDVRNAEVRMFHTWSASLVGVASNDTQHHALIFSSEPNAPAGTSGKRAYVILNTREGMTRPGQWYLDRTAGRLVYWPQEGEDMTALKVIAPAMEEIVRIAGAPEKKAQNITIRNLTFSGTTAPLHTAGFGGAGFPGAVALDQANGCVLDRLDIREIGGLGIRAENVSHCRVAGCNVHHIGALGVKISGTDTEIADNHIDHVGIYYPSAAASMMGGQGLRICRNEIHDAPYSGIISGGKGNLIENNLIYRVMRVMHDGAAIYGGMNACVIRGNVVRDVVVVGKGYGASAYYLDEGARDCVIERNVAVGVPTPTHNHITYNTVVRDNVFVADGDMTVSFQGSSKCTFERNTLIVPGQFKVTQPNAVRSWEGNMVFRGGSAGGAAPQPCTIGGDKPEARALARKSEAVLATRVDKAPVLDGEITVAEWPGKLYNLDRQPSRLPGCGPPASLKCASDGENLYVGVIVSLFNPAVLRDGSVWGEDDGVEICIAGKTPDGHPAVFVVRGFVNGTTRSVTDAGAPAAAAESLGEAVRFAVKPIKGSAGKPRGWRAEWAIPLAALGLKPEGDTTVPFNASVYQSEFDEWHCWEGTSAKTWQEQDAGRLEFPQSGKKD